MNIPMNLPKKALLLVALCAVVLIGAFYFYSTNPASLSAANSAATFQGKSVDLIVDSSQIPDTYLAKGPSLKLPTALKGSITKVSTASNGAVTSEKLAAATQLCPSQWDEDGKCYKYVASNVAEVTSMDCSKLTGIAKSTCLLKSKSKQAVKLTCQQDAAVPADQETKECGEKPQTQPSKTPANQTTEINGSFKSGRTPTIDCFYQFNSADNTMLIGWNADQLGEHHISLHLASDGTSIYNMNPNANEFLSRPIQVSPVEIYDLVVTAPYNGRTLDCQMQINLAAESIPLATPEVGEDPVFSITNLQMSELEISTVKLAWVAHRAYNGQTEIIDQARPAYATEQYLLVTLDANHNGRADQGEVNFERTVSSPYILRNLKSDTNYVAQFTICGSNREMCNYEQRPTISFRTKPTPLQQAVSANQGAQADLTLLDGAVADARQNISLNLSSSSSNSATNSLIRNGLIGRTNSPVIGVISNVRDRISAGVQDGFTQAGIGGNPAPIDDSVGANLSAVSLVSRFTLSAGQAANQNLANEFIAKGQIQNGLSNLAVNTNKTNATILLALTAITQTREASNLTLWLLKANTVDLNTLPNKTLVTFTLAERTSSFSGLRAGNYIIAGRFCTQLNRCEINASTFTLTADGKLTLRRDVSAAVRAQLQQAAPAQPNQNENPAVPVGGLVISPIKVTKANTLGFTKNVDVKWSTQPKANYTLVLKSLVGGLALTRLQNAAMTLTNDVKLNAKPGSYNVSVFACASKDCKVAYTYFKVAANGAVTILNAPAVVNGELSSVNIVATQLPKEGQHFVVNVSWMTNVNANATLAVIKLLDESNVPVAAPLGYNRGKFVKLPIHESLVPNNFKATITSCTAANVCISNETLFNVDSNGLVTPYECDPLIMAQCPPLRDAARYNLTINSYVWAVSGLKLTLTNPNTDAITITEVSVGQDPGQNFVPVEIQPDEQKVVNWPYGCGISGYQVGDQYNEDLAIKYDTFLGPEVKYEVMQGICADVLNPDQEVNGANAELAFTATLTGLQATQNSLDLTWEATLPNSHNLTLYEIDSNARLEQIQAGDLNGVRVINLASPVIANGVAQLQDASPFRLNVPGLQPNTLYVGFMTVCAAPNLGLQCVDLDLQAFTRDASQAQFESDLCPLRKVNGKCMASVQISRTGVAQANRVELYPRDAALRKFIQLTMDNTLDQECLEQAFALAYGGFDELNILYSIRGFAVPFSVQNDVYKLANANIADGICNLRLDHNADGSYCLAYPATAALCDPNVSNVEEFPVIQGPDFNDPVGVQDVPVAANGDAGDRGSSARIRNGNNNYLLFPCEQTHLCPPEQTTPVYDDGSSNGGFVDSTPVQQPVQKPVTKPTVSEPTKDKPKVTEESNFVDSQAVLIAAIVTLILLLGGLFFAFKRK